MTWHRIMLSPGGEDPRLYRILALQLSIRTA